MTRLVKIKKLKMRPNKASKVKKALIRDAVIRIYEASKVGKSVSVVGGDLNRPGNLADTLKRTGKGANKHVEQA